MSIHTSTPPRSPLRGVIALRGVLVLALLALAASPAWAQERISEEERIRAGDVREIEVLDQRSNWGIVLQNRIDTEIRLRENRENRITVSLVGSVRSNRRGCVPSLDTESRGGDVTVRLRSCGGPVFFLSMSGTLTLEVSVPRDWAGTYRVDAASSDVTLDAERLDRVDVDVSSGSVDVGSLSAADLRIHTSSGDIAGAYLQGDALELDTSSGDIRISEVAGSVRAGLSSGDLELNYAGNRGSVEADSSSGSITVRGIDGAVEADTTSGSVDVDFARLGAGSKMDTSSGNVRIALPRDTGFTVDLDTSSGGIHLDFPVQLRGDMQDDELEADINGGGPTIEVETSSGNINIVHR